MGTEVVASIACARCGTQRDAKPTKAGAPRLPRGWKRERDGSPNCDRCWHATYMLRAIVLPIAGPVDGTWDDLRADLHACWSDATRLANWATLELARADIVRTAEMTRLPQMPRVYLYPGARKLVPDMDSGSVVALLQQVESRYRSARYDVVWRSARALPTYKYPAPYPIHNQRWSVAFDEQNVPYVTVPLAGRKWTLRLRRKNRGRQLAAIRRLVDGEAHQGELALYQRGSDVLCKLVLWLPRPAQTNQPKVGTLYIHTAENSFLVYRVDDEEPRHLHADDIRRVCAMHRRRLERISNDTNAEKRRSRSERRGINQRRNLWAQKYRARMDSWTHEITALLANYAARRGVERVVYSDGARAYLPDAPYHRIRELLRWKLDERGIALELANGVVDGDGGTPSETEG